MKVKTNKIKTREQVNHPYQELSLNERLVRSKAIDLTDNHTIAQQGHYLIVRPIDKNKRIYRAR